MMPSNKSETKPKPSPTSFSFDAIGTRWLVEVYDPLTPRETSKLERSILDRIDKFDKNYSRFRDDSLVTEMSRTAGTYHLPDDAQPMIDLYKNLYDATGGAMTPLIGQVLSDAGYDAKYSLKPKELKCPPSWDEALNYKSGTLSLHSTVLLDFGALGKGYLVDIIGSLLKSRGIGSFCIDASGDLLYEHPSKTIRVGLENPNDETQAIGIVEIQNKALCGSAGNRRKWQGYHHIINPHTLTSPNHLQAVWVMAESTILADGLATALFFAPAEKLQKLYNFDYALFHADNSLSYSRHFPGTFFS